MKSGAVYIVGTGGDACTGVAQHCNVAQHSFVEAYIIRYVSGCFRRNGVLRYVAQHSVVEAKEL